MTMTALNIRPPFGCLFLHAYHAIRPNLQYRVVVSCTLFRESARNDNSVWETA